MERDEIFKISPDERRSDALKRLAENRKIHLKDLKEPYRIIEEYYEIIKELITAFMYKKGFKTLSHKALVEFAKYNMKELTTREISLVDELRIKRNNIVYYGETVTDNFLKTRRQAIDVIINKLSK